MENNRVKDFDALSEIALKINTLRDPVELQEEVLQTAMDALDAERGFVLLHKPEDDVLYEVHAHTNISERQLGEMVRISNSVVREVLQSGEPVLLFEAEKDDRYGSTESIVIEKIQSIACVPLKRHNKLIGAIYLDSVTKRGKFVPQSLPFIQAIANQAAVAIENAQLYHALREENRHLRSEVTRAYGFEEIIGNSGAMQEVFETMSRVIDTDASVLISGESGTGKELVARAIHYNGARKDKPFVAVFCGSLPDALLESELFGHKKGSFTGANADKKGLFEAADGGTIFLDEVSELSQRMQTALLRVLQEGEIKRVGDTSTRAVDVRIVSATNRPLSGQIAEGEFREDLYYRLNTIELDLPPLRHRRTDIPILAQHFLTKYAKGSRDRIRGFDPDAVEALRGYSWPGNVRELENTIERGIVMCRGEVVQVEDLRLKPDKLAAVEEIEMQDIPLKQMERQHVESMLERVENNVSEAARRLGVSRRWLHYRIKEWEGEDN